MGRLTTAAGPASVVAMDAAVFIYYLGAEAPRGPLIREFFLDLTRGDVRGLASIVALLETLVRPLRLQQPGVVADYNAFFSEQPNLVIRDVTAAVARRAAQIRAEHNFLLPDSIHLATAMESGADCFLTNDRRLSRFPSLPVLIVDDFIDSGNGSASKS